MNYKSLLIIEDKIIYIRRTCLKIAFQEINLKTLFLIWNFQVDHRNDFLNPKRCLNFITKRDLSRISLTNAYSFLKFRYFSEIFPSWTFADPVYRYKKCQHILLYKCHTMFASRLRFLFLFSKKWYVQNFWENTWMQNKF